MIGRLIRILGPLGILGIVAIALATAALPHHGFREGSDFALVVEMSGDPVVAFAISVAIYCVFLFGFFAFALWAFEGVLERLDR